jgi:DNA-binding transcriptional ArsR family regulator
MTFDLLTDERRRAILTLLKDQQELTVREVAEELTETPLTGQELSKVTAELVHCHLPKLKEANVVQVDSSGSRICYTGNVVLEGWFSEVRTR